MNAVHVGGRELVIHSSELEPRAADGVHELSKFMRGEGVVRHLTNAGVTVDYLSYDSDAFKQYRWMSMGHRRDAFRGRQWAVVRVNPDNAEFALVLVCPTKVFFHVRVRKVDRPYVQGLTQADHRERVKSATEARRLLLRGKPLSTI